MAVKQPKLPYATDYLAPQISKETLEFHHGKHHMAYFNKLKELTEGKPEANKTLEELVRTTDGVLFNQAAQIYNHCFYWHSMKNNKSKAPNPPTGKVKSLIESSFGSFEEFKKQFSATAGGHFGSGWAWLVLKEGNKLEILAGHDADCPLKGNRGKPIICCDVWEHAYYIDYRNARPTYIQNWWEIINWDFANSNLENEFTYDQVN